MVTRALASRRFRVTVTGPGGHAWTDAGAPNPILILARALLALEALPSLAAPAGSPRTTLNIGQICWRHLDQLHSRIRRRLHRPALHRRGPSCRLQRKLCAARSSTGSLIRQSRTLHLSHGSVSNPSGALTIEIIGDRPGGSLADDSHLLTTLRAVDRHLNLRTEPGLGSTDANIPLSLGIPAIAIGAGGLGGGIHTLQEWYDPTGRNNALRRILLTLLDTAQLAVPQSSSAP